jgi:hypothetical protein
LHDQPKGDDSGFRLPPTVAEDLSAQATTLIYVLAISPNHLTVPDLIGEIAKDSGDFGETDRIDRAIRDLTETGLLCNVGGVIRPTRAAQRFAQVLSGVG